MHQLCFTSDSDEFLKIQIILNPECFLEPSHHTSQDAEQNCLSPFLFSLFCLSQHLEQKGLLEFTAIRKES